MNILKCLCLVLSILRYISKRWCYSACLQLQSGNLRYTWFCLWKWVKTFWIIRVQISAWNPVVKNPVRFRAAKTARENANGARYDCFKLCIWLVERMVRDFWTNHGAKFNKTKTILYFFCHSIENSSIVQYIKPVWKGHLQYSSEISLKQVLWSVNYENWLIIPNTDNFHFFPYFYLLHSMTFGPFCRN